MTTSFSVTRDQIVMAALRKLSVVEPNDTAATTDSSILSNA
jgi:BarA-like signal transduction histidine kinase